MRIGINTMRFRLLAPTLFFFGQIILAVGLICVGSAVHAQTAQIRTGTLICKGKGGIGLILGSRERLLCAYTPSGSGPRHNYHGTITRIGLDIGIKGKSTMVWGVLGSTTNLSAEALGGTFGGVSADIALGIGAGANILVGGNNKSIVLQPLSVKGQVGLNLVG